MLTQSRRVSPWADSIAEGTPSSSSDRRRSGLHPPRSVHTHRLHRGVGRLRRDEPAHRERSRGTTGVLVDDLAGSESVRITSPSDPTRRETHQPAMEYQGASNSNPSELKWWITSRTRRSEVNRTRSPRSLSRARLRSGRFSNSRRRCSLQRRQPNDQLSELLRCRPAQLTRRRQLRPHDRRCHRSTIRNPRSDREHPIRRRSSVSGSMDLLPGAIGEVPW